MNINDPELLKNVMFSSSSLFYYFQNLLSSFISERNKKLMHTLHVPCTVCRSVYVCVRVKLVFKRLSFLFFFISFWISSFVCAYISFSIIIDIMNIICKNCLEFNSLAIIFFALLFEYVVAIMVTLSLTKCTN